MVLSITIDDTQAVRIGEAFDLAYPSRPAGVSKAQWVKRKVIDYIREVVKGHEATTAGEAARKAAADAAESEVTPT